MPARGIAPGTLRAREGESFRGPGCPSATLHWDAGHRRDGRPARPGGRADRHDRAGGGVHRRRCLDGVGDSRTSGAPRASGRDTTPTTSRSRTSCARRMPGAGTGRSGGSCTPRSDRPQPNPAHRALVALERLGLLDSVITQNVDDLHQRAGTDPTKVIELHGNATRVRCLGCDRRYARDDIQARLLTGESVPACGGCGGILKPLTVLFGEPMPAAAVQRAEARARAAGCFLVVGSSLAVYPAAYMPTYAKEAGARLVVVNLTPTRLDHVADVVLAGPAARDAGRTRRTSRGPCDPLRQDSEGCRDAARAARKERTVRKMMSGAIVAGVLMIAAGAGAQTAGPSVEPPSRGIVPVTGPSWCRRSPSQPSPRWCRKRSGRRTAPARARPAGRRVEGHRRDAVGQAREGGPEAGCQDDRQEEPGVEARREGRRDLRRRSR